MSYARDPFDTDEAPCVCDLDDGPVLTTAEHCPAHGVDAEDAAHLHGTSEPGWQEHNHLGGGIPHRHDPETGVQIPLREEELER